MPPRIFLHALNIFLLLLLPAAPSFGKEVGGPVRGDQRWEGEIVLREQVRVTPDATLVIAPGTRIRPAGAEAGITVQGSISVRGTAERPAVFSAPPGWKGIELLEARPGSAFENARFEGGESAVSAIASSFSLRRCTFRQTGGAVRLLREAKATIEECLFADNRLGIENDMKSSVTIRSNRFTGHAEAALVGGHGSSGPVEKNVFEKNAQGIALVQKFSGTIAGNTFRENGTAILCKQTQSSPLIRDNLFEKNENALINFSFAYPPVQGNRFIANATAIRNDQFGSPVVTRNLFRGNGTALFNQRKSSPNVEKNRLEKNEVALFCDFSSYPRVRGNSFEGNRMAVKLGIYQSADFEKRAGSSEIMQKEAAARNSRNPLLPEAPTKFRDVVDVSGNWWGKDTPLLARAGKDGNLPFFHDRLDQPEVAYPGYGPAKYRLDRIVFAPWLEREVPEAGLHQSR